MSGPTRGMVAGQPIQTGATSDEYREAHDRIFGKDRKPQRGRYVFVEELGKCVPVGEDWSDTPRRAQVPTEEIVYGNAKATDGTPINSRKKHREYLKRNGLAMANDFSEGYRERVKKSREEKDSKHLRETVERAFYKSRRG